MDGQRERERTTDVITRVIHILLVGCREKKKNLMIALRINPAE